MAFFNGGVLALALDVIEPSDESHGFACFALRLHLFRQDLQRLHQLPPGMGEAADVHDAGGMSHAVITAVAVGLQIPRISLEQIPGHLPGPAGLVVE